MPRCRCAVLFLVFLAPTADPAAFLAEARAKHLDLISRGLSSFTADFVLRRSKDPNAARWKDLAGFSYAFSAPESEEFLFTKTPEAFRKPLREALGSFWRDVTGALWFDVLGKVAGGALEVVGGTTVFHGGEGLPVAVRAVFEDGSRRLVEFEAGTVKILYGYSDTEWGHRVAWRDVSLAGKRALRTTYRSWREVNGFVLPTVVDLETADSRTEYLVRYVLVNGQPAKVAEPDPAAVKALVAEYEKGWKALSESQKIGAMLDLAETEHDLVSAAIAKTGLRDPGADVREQAAEILGVLGRPNVVPALLAALKANEDEIRVYLRVILALGEIGDPRAVDALSKDWWNQRIGEYGIAAAKAKILALGNIRHATSVDALIDTFFMAKEETIGLVKGEIVESLTKLTGQKFDYDRNAWKDWWKKARADFRFE